MKLPPRGSLHQQLVFHVERAVDHCIQTQDARGAWQSLPDARILDTGLAAYALSRTPSPASDAAVARARMWLRDATPQSHHDLARLLDEAPRLILNGSHREIDLTDPEFYTEVYLRKTLLLYALATFAGLRIRIPFEPTYVRAQVREYYERCDNIQIKLWNKIDLISVYILIEAAAGRRSGLSEPCRRLEALQSPDGSFCYNPLSTAMAYIALSEAAPDSAALPRCRAHLLETQQNDGTWRFCISDIWDTTLTIRTFRDHVRFRREALPAAIAFLEQTQNPDGGWGFRSHIESDNDTSSCALLALQDLEPDSKVCDRALSYLARLQMRDGLWRTWQSGGDPPVDDAVAHVIEALLAFPGRHRVSVDGARRWIVERYGQHGLWIAGWYRNLPYAVLEVGRSLGDDHPAARQATDALIELQNADGGWAGEPGAQSLPSATGLAITSLLRTYSVDEPFIQRGLTFLMEAQLANGTWRGQPELYGPRPLLYHLPTNTHAFASGGLLAAIRCLRAREV